MIVISNGLLAAHHFSEKLRDLLRRLIKTPLDPLVQKTEQTIKR